MTRRLFSPPESIVEVARRAGGRLALVRGEALALAPPGSAELALPRPIIVPPGREAVIARVDVEELWAFGRPVLETVDYARNFYITDGSAAALVQLAGAGGRVHPDVELQIGGAFVEQPLEPAPGAESRAAFVRVVREGDPVFVFGRARAEQDHAGLAAASYREPSLMAVFDAEAGPLYVYDAIAFEALARWHALPWYRKLSVIVRNR